MISRLILLAIISLDVLLLLYQTTTISISSHEAHLLYGNFSFIQWLEKIFLKLLGHNDLILRLPMIVFHLFSVILLYNILIKYLKDVRYRLWTLLVFILLPGVISSALMIDSAGFIIFGLLLFMYIYENYSLKITYPLLFIFSIVDGGFIYLFISLVSYSFYTKNKLFFFLNIFLLGISLFFHRIELHGAPEGHLLDTLGLYSAIFTPIIFLYIFYILYRRFLTKDINLLWFISSVPLFVSIVLSFRQQIDIASFAPYFIMAIPLAGQTFLSSYKVRLRIFRRKYKIIFFTSFVFLLINFLLVIFNKEVYIFIKNPEKHFARKMHVAKELSVELKKKNILCVSTEESMSKRLNFYGIGICNTFLLYEVSLDSKDTKDTVTVSYKYRPIYKAIVTNINN